MASLWWNFPQQSRHGIKGYSQRFEFIYPTQEWKTLTLETITAGDFEVDEEEFYIKVVEN